MLGDMIEHARYRLLVVSNETVEGDALHELIARRSALQPTQVVVVAPALEEDRAAEARLGRALCRLESAGVRADGWVGDADPMQAIDDALRVFAADALIVASHPEQRSGWPVDGLLRRARATFDVPITHLVVDVAAQREYAAA
jgi:nucleotide-binding universal stress UspA family protein